MRRSHETPLLEQSGWRGFAALPALFGNWPHSLMDCEQLDQWCERAVLGLVLAILVYSPLAFGGVGLGQFVVIEWLTVALLAAWLCRFWINPKHRLLWPPV